MNFYLLELKGLKIQVITLKTIVLWEKVIKKHGEANYLPAVMV
jgi:hypothetical protein